MVHIFTRDKRKILKDHAYFSAKPSHGLFIQFFEPNAINTNRTTIVFGKPDKAVKESRFAYSAGPHKAENFIVGNGKADIFQDVQIIKMFIYIRNLDHLL